MASSTRGVDSQFARLRGPELRCMGGRGYCPAIAQKNCSEELLRRAVVRLNVRRGHGHALCGDYSGRPL
jgi:hypothetical protein